MKIIEPKVELWLPDNNISHVAKCARICYDSKSNNDDQLYNALIKNKHWSMFRHETHYFMIPTPSHIDDIIDTIINLNGGQPWFDCKSDLNNYLCIVTNGNWCLDNKEIYIRLKEYEVNMHQFEDLHLEESSILNMMRYTFCITTQISTSRELNRVSPNNISERSTRYVNESEGIICRPHWIFQQDCELYNETCYVTEYGSSEENAYEEYLYHCESAFEIYKNLLKNGIPKEDARGVLPLDTATKVVYTYNVDEWEHIIDLRYNGITGKPHPNVKYVIGLVKKQLEELGYDVK